jgi:hypothetical protein
LAYNIILIVVITTNGDKQNTRGVIFIALSVNDQAIENHTPITMPNINIHLPLPFVQESLNPFIFYNQINAASPTIKAVNLYISTVIG